MDAKFRSPKSYYPVLSIVFLAVVSVALALVSSPAPSSLTSAIINGDVSGVSPEAPGKLSPLLPAQVYSHDANPPSLAVSDSTPISKPDDGQANSAGAVITDRTGGTISLRLFKLVNNKWGAPANEDLTSAVYLGQGSRFGWYWNRQDPKTKQGNHLVLPIYPSVRIGGNHLDQSALAPFPVKLSAVQSLTGKVDYDYPEAPAGVYNFAYDMFLLDKDKSGTNATRKAEIMIWIQGTISQLPQTYKGDFSDGHNTYALYSFVMSDGRLYSAFIMKGQPQFPFRHEVDIKTLLDNFDLNPDWYIPGIELGNEIVSGCGKIEISRLSLNLNGAVIEY